MRRLGGIIIALTGVACALTAPVSADARGRCGTHPWCNTALSAVARADKVLAAMTTSEKIAFIGGDSFNGGVSSGPNQHTGVQDGVPRLEVPTVYYTDGPLGPRQGDSTGMPAPLGLAAAFDPALARSYGSIVGNESRDKGNDVVYGPTVNMMRTPLGGRTYEAFGEDPFLTSQITVPWIEGLQAQGVLADIKHFAEYNQEGADPTGKANYPGAPIGAGTLGSRYLSNSVVDERTMHEIELMPFEAAVSHADPATVMCSYNQLNGQYACENTKLLQGILRRQWGFHGYVLADYGAAHNTIASMNDGLDFEPWPPFAYQPAELAAALASHAVSMRTLDDHVRNILATWFRFGVFDRAAYRNDDALIDKRAHARAARRIEQQAITMLLNRRHQLPLARRHVRRIAVIGMPASQFVTGGGSGNVVPFQFTSILSGIRSDVGRRAVVTYDDGSNQAAAAAHAKAANVAVVVASDYYTEGADRSCLTLECPNNYGNQDALIASVAAANPHTVVVLESGGPDLTPWRAKIAALVEAWYPGGPGGKAVADVLFGKADPGGRLPVTFPADPSQIPTAGDPAKYPGIANNVYYKEGVLSGYRWYDAKHEQPAFPFGFGLSYTRFRFSHLKLRRLIPGSRVGVSVTVTNRGRRRGSAVVEVYVSIPGAAARVEPPVELEAFVKVGLAPHRSRRVSTTLARAAFSYWDIGTHHWRIAAACDTVLVGSSSRNLPLRGRIGEGGRSCGTRRRAHGTR